MIRGLLDDLNHAAAGGDPDRAKVWHLVAGVAALIGGMMLIRRFTTAAAVEMLGGGLGAYAELDRHRQAAAATYPGPDDIDPLHRGQADELVDEHPKAQD